MGQKLARHYMDDGVRLYHVHKRELAINKWRLALDKLKRAEDRFITMGYLAQAYCEVGKHRDMLIYAMHQIDLANVCDDSYMKAEAYLNLARASQSLAEYHKAIAYSRHSIQHASLDPRTPGYAYLCMAQAHIGFSQFQLALEHYELAMQVASASADKLLELQICVGLGAFFTLLRDLTKAVVFLQNALALLKTITLPDVQAKYRSLILYHMSTALRHNGALLDAKAAGEEALRLSTDNGHQPVQARCLHALGDIHLQQAERQAAMMHYEAAYGLFRMMGDRYAQVHVLASMARAAADLHRHDPRQCECQALQLNKKCLEMAKEIGCKLAMLKCHARLQSLYGELSDEESVEVASKAVTALTQELELFCNLCGQRYGHRDEALQAMACSHLFHQRCLHKHLTSAGSSRSSTATNACLKCQAQLSARQHLPTSLPRRRPRTPTYAPSPCSSSRQHSITSTTDVYIEPHQPSTSGVQYRQTTQHHNAQRRQPTTPRHDSESSSSHSRSVTPTPDTYRGSARDTPTQHDMPQPPPDMLTKRLANILLTNDAIDAEDIASSSANSTTEQPSIRDVFAGRAPSASVSLDDVREEKTAAEQLADELDAIRHCSESITPTATLTRNMAGRSEHAAQPTRLAALSIVQQTSRKKSVTIVEAVTAPPPMHSSSVGNHAPSTSMSTFKRSSQPPPVPLKQRRGAPLLYLCEAERNNRDCDVNEVVSRPAGESSQPPLFEQLDASDV